MQEVKFRVREESTNKIVAYEYLKEGMWRHEDLSDNPSPEGDLPERYGVFTKQCFGGGGYHREVYIGLKDKNDEEVYEECM